METLLERNLYRVQEIVEEHGPEPGNLIPILQDLQREYRYLPEEVLSFVATMMHLPRAQIYGVATFYTQFSLQPKGKYVIQVCDGTACHVRQSESIHTAIEDELGLKGDDTTTEDLLFTLEKVACIGACSLAPVIMINGETYGHLEEDTARDIIKTYREKG